MVEDWELKELRRELNGLERRFEEAERSVVDFKEIRRIVDRLEQRDRKRSERMDWWLAKIAWTLYVVALTTYIVLSVTGSLHHH